MNRNQEIARTILAQLGGKRFCVMTGARDFIAIEDGLFFSLPRLPGVKINRVRIRLTPSDTYTVEFLRLYGTKMTTVSEVSDVYCDTLAATFEHATGLATSLTGQCAFA